MEPNPIRTASHIGLWIMAVGIIIYLVYAGTHTSTEHNNYAPGAASTDVKYDGFRLLDEFNILKISCVPKGISDNWGKPNVGTKANNPAGK